MPLRAVKKIEFSGVPDLKESEASAPTQVGGEFAREGKITLDSARVEEGRIKGLSSNFGMMDLDMRAFRRLTIGKN